jgi:AbrB family looped-hinge helix DNA binding protein
MTQIKTRIGAGGRVVIPAAVREEMGVRPGDEVILVADDEGVRLVTSAQALRRARRMVAKWIPRGRNLAKELIAERRREAARD